MAKGSYFQKFKATNTDDFQSLPIVKASEVDKQACEAGEVLLIDKPVHWTSFDVVRKIRNSLGIKKVGHAGTLDPLATGLLIVCTGKATKKINDLMKTVKEYTGTIILGAVTPTYDLESDPQNFKPIDHITIMDIRNATVEFIGEQMQIPPVYSAIKVAGTPLYELARRGKEVEIQARPITIFGFDILDYEPPEVHFRVLCSSGTYIRSLAHDLGKQVGCGGYLSSLRRTKVGEYRIENAFTLDAFLQLLATGNMFKKDS